MKHNYSNFMCNFVIKSQSKFFFFLLIITNYIYSSTTSNSIKQSNKKCHMPAVASNMDLFGEFCITAGVWKMCNFRSCQNFSKWKAKHFAAERQFKPTTLCQHSRNFLKEIANAKLGFSFIHDWSLGGKGWLMTINWLCKYTKYSQ